MSTAIQPAPQAAFDSDEKNRIDHVDKLETEQEYNKGDEPPAGILKKSRFDELSLWQTLWVFRHSAFYTFLVYIGYMAEGFELNGGNSIIANRGFVAQFGSTQAGAEGSVLRLNTSWVSAWGAMLNVGQMITFCYIGLIADRFGRCVCFYLSFTYTLIAIIIYNVAKTAPVWAVGKIFNGMGIGILQVVAQIYVMEICPNRIRGGMIAFQAIWNNIGGILVSLMMQQMNKKTPLDYLTPLRILFAPVAIIIFCWIWLPESPWFHARRGNKEKALKCMGRLYGKIEGYNAEEEYSIIIATIKHEQESMKVKPRYREVFRGLNLRRTLTIILLSVSSQFGGLGMIGTYSTYFFAIAGLADPFLGTLILSLCNLLMVTIWTFTCDKFGRRIFTCSAHVVVMACCITCGGLYYVGGGATGVNSAAGTALLFICCVWTMSWQIINKAYPLYSAELPAAILRVRTGPITFAANSIMGLATSFAIPPMLVALNLRAGWVFAAFSVPCNVGLWYYLPETKGRSAGEIDELFQRRIPAWKWNSTKTETEEYMHNVAAERRVDA